jgi:hypothetical protein
VLLYPPNIVAAAVDAVGNELHKPETQPVSMKKPYPVNR